MKSLESFSENVIGFRMVHAIIGHRVYPCDLFCFYGYKSGRTWVETQTFIEGKRMKFKNKIIISFCIIIFVPIFLATLVLFSMQHIQMRAIEQTYGVEGDGYSYFSNSVQLLSRFTREIYREVYKVADNQPEKLEDGA